MTTESHIIEVRDVNLSVPCFVHKESSGTNVAASLIAGFYSQIRREYRDILTNVSLTLHDGDRLALLGRNGAGKTTLLHVLAGAYAPTTGSVRVVGARQALLNISLGFNGDATVRENVVLRGTAIGMTFREIREQLPAMLEFAELQGKANDRFSTLSAGQRLRLAFSVVTAQQPDILLLDEWISAGDIAFLRKAQGRLSDIVKESRIFVLASHSLELLRSVCNKGLVLEQGRVTYFGDIAAAIDVYSDSMKPKMALSKSAALAAPVAAVQEAKKRRELQQQKMGIPAPSFPHHLLHENRVAISGNLSEHKALLEIQDIPVAEAMIGELAAVPGRGGRIDSVSVVAGGTCAEIVYSDGARVVMTFKKYDGSVAREFVTGVGTCHIAWRAPVPAESA